MPMKMVLESLEEVDEALHSLYVEKDGKFVLDLEGDLITEDDVANLKSALQKERDARKTFEKQAKAGLSPEEKAEFDRLKKEKETTERKSLEKKGEYDKLIEKLQAEREAEKAELMKSLEEEKSRTTRLYVKDKIRAAAVASGVLKDNVEDVITLTANRFRLEDDEIVVLDDDGELSADNVKTFFEKTFKIQRPIYYEPSGPPGTGSQQTTTGRKTKTGDIVLSTDDAKDVQKYRQAKEVAEKAGGELRVERPA